MNITLEKMTEQKLIKHLIKLGYIYREDINDKDTLHENFRKHFNRMNGLTLSDQDFNNLCTDLISTNVFDCAEILRTRQYFERDDKTPLYYNLMDTKDWCKNTFEIVNQLKLNTDNSHHRYDVIILMNGLPVVQIELKRQLESIHKAVEQIVKYKNDKGNPYRHSLMCFMQLFIVSNQHTTKYFTNNNAKFFSFDAKSIYTPIYQLATFENKSILNLTQFTDIFFKKCALAEHIARHMILVKNNKQILMMRPYQIFAVENIMSTTSNEIGNGYIWHTTGSGKTLTSFKAATLLKEDKHIYKCLFVVDRKDLDTQTREEFNSFQNNCVEENANTQSLINRLLSPEKSDKIIVTTIQKLNKALQEQYVKQLTEIKNKKIVFIFDECHRSQFGKSHNRITEFFQNNQLFGFTGTPIFSENSYKKKVDEEEKYSITTKDIFCEKLHAYTIENAIHDNNVLRFRIDYYPPEENKQKVVEKIIEIHDKATANRKFNAIFATASIKDAIEYYKLFKHKDHHLNITCVFSTPPGVSKSGDQLREDLEEEQENHKQNSTCNKKRLQEIITDYNEKYSTTHKVTEFDDYYRDIQKRIKDQQWTDNMPQSEKIDITIVVQMLLTGFDSKYLNTLYVDKKLRWHNLIQAFSRTNRILDNTKPFGNIIDFRNQQDAVEEAIKMFSQNENDEKIVWIVDTADEVIKNDLIPAVEGLKDFITSHSDNNTDSIDSISNIKRVADKIEFCKKFKAVQEVKNRLDQYTNLEDGQKQQIDGLISDEYLIEAKERYLEFRREIESLDPVDLDDDDRQQINDYNWELSLIASQIIDYDYIISLIGNIDPKIHNIELEKQNIIRLIKSDPKLENKADDLEAFINNIDMQSPWTVSGDLNEYINKEFEKFVNIQYKKSIQNIADNYDLEFDFMKNTIDTIIDRQIFNREEFNDALRIKGYGWKDRKTKLHQITQDIKPILRKKLGNIHITGLDT